MRMDKELHRANGGRFHPRTLESVASRGGVSPLSALAENSKSVFPVSQCLVSPRVSYLAVDESLAR